MRLSKKYYKLLAYLLLLLSLCWTSRFLLFVRPTASFPLDLKWQVDLGNSTYERPTFQNGLVLFPANKSFSSTWYGLEATTGQVIWSQAIFRNSYRRCLTSEHLVISGPRFLGVLNPQNGNIIWAEGIGNAATCSATTIFAIGNRGFVQALDIASGQYLWRGVTPKQPFRGLIYNFEAGELIADGRVIINSTSGQLLRTIEPSFRVHTPTDQGRGPMYLIDDKQLFIGDAIWNIESGDLFYPQEQYGAFAAPTMTDDTIYIADAGEHPFPSGVIALDRATYTVKWKYQPQHKLPGFSLITLSPVAIFDGVGYVIFSDATLRVFDLETGQELGYWQPQGLDLMFWPGCTLPFPQLPNPFDCVHSSGVGMATSDDTLFVSFGDGKLYAFGE